MISFNFLKKLNLRLLAYALVLVTTLGLFLGLIAWAATDAAATDAEASPAEVVLDLGVRKEYLVGEKISAAGIRLVADGVTYSDCEISCDTSSAGLKQVEVTHKSEDKNLRGYFSVTVYKARHYDLRVYPDRFYTDENGDVKYDGRFTLWAEFNAEPSEFTVPDRYGTVVVVPPSVYEVKAEQDENDENGYTVSLSYGSTSLNYYFVNLGDRAIQMDNRDRVLEFTNQSGGEETLKLYVTQIETNGNDGENGAEGYYVYTAADGAKSVLRFKFYLTGYSSNFVSANFGEGITDAYNGEDEGFDATFAGGLFHADRASWHRAVLGGSL